MTGFKNFEFVAGLVLIVLIGGAGGQLQGGRILNYLDKPNRKMCSLFLSMMDKYGIYLKKFGDSTERLPQV